LLSFAFFLLFFDTDGELVDSGFMQTSRNTGEFVGPLDGDIVGTG
jgi:hypothetical protein